MNSARFIALRVLLLVGMAFTAMLAVDAYTAGDATFCTGEESGCEAVKLSPLAAPFGVPLPYVGLAGFVYLMLLTFGGARVAPLFRLSLLGAGVVGVGLLAYQAFGLHTFCELCVVVDVSLALAAAVGLPRNLSFPAPPMALPTGAWLLLMAVVVAAPGVYRRLPEPRPIPEFVEKLRADEGITIVEVADFGCRHCRALQKTMAAALEGREGVTLRRVIVPITRHRLGQSAAQVYRCAERYGIQDELALKLADDAFLEAGVERWIAELPETEGDLRKCMIEAEIRKSVTADRYMVQRAGIDGIPMTYVGDTVLRGAVSEARIVRAIRLEKVGITEQRPPLAVFAGMVLVLVALIVVPAIALARQRARASS